MGRTAALEHIVTETAGTQTSDSVVGTAARGWAWLTQSSH